mmetsp:Transcript_27628/g.42511  ORF Transcript_27628/g.42511 Transcript_27628/m.42511 type:complete len:220 (-) Transcript_27628:1838-2497(-)
MPVLIEPATIATMIGISGSCNLISIIGRRGIIVSSQIGTSLVFVWSCSALPIPTHSQITISSKGPCTTIVFSSHSLKGFHGCCFVSLSPLSQLFRFPLGPFLGFSALSFSFSSNFFCALAFFFAALASSFCPCLFFCRVRFFFLSPFSEAIYFFIQNITSRYHSLNNISIVDILASLCSETTNFQRVPQGLHLFIHIFCWIIETQRKRPTSTVVVTNSS